MQKKKSSVFPGGVHPTDGTDKILSMDKAVQQYWPDTVTILSEQSFGGKCRFVVSPGDTVAEGQLIGEPEAFMAAPLHASVSGKVLEIKEVLNQGRKIPACIIEREKEHQETDWGFRKEAADISGISREEILSRVWSDEVIVLDRTIDVNITRLRRKISPYSEHIVTRQGYGYGFEE